MILFEQVSNEHLLTLIDTLEVSEKAFKVGSLLSIRILKICLNRILFTFSMLLKCQNILSFIVNVLQLYENIFK